ncbi:MAG TPA: ABC transporter permease [Streptosporangiaceae bacterium]
MTHDPGRAGGLHDLVTVARRELVVRVRSKAFRISTILLLAVTVASIAIAAALMGRTQHVTVAVTAQAPPAVASTMRAQGSAAGLSITTVTVADRAAAIRSVEHGRSAAAVAARGEIIWKSRPRASLQQVLTAAVQGAIINQRAASLGLPNGAVARLLAPIRVTVTQLHAGGNQAQWTARSVVAYAGVLLLYIAIAVYGGYVLTGVVEEKSSRVVEVLLSRVPPSSLLGGKIAGIGLAGLTQLLAVGAAAAATLGVVKPSGIPPGTVAALPMLVVWFVLGFAFYSVLYGSLGSLASRTQDAQAAAAPVAVLIAGIYVLAVVALSNPSAGWVAVLSMLPPSAPILMPLRAALVPVPVWQVVAALVLLLGATYGLFRVGARVYENAILHTGQRLRLREAWRGESARPRPAHR